MDDIGPAPYEAAQIEVFINKLLSNGQLPEYIADELLKKWDTTQLPLEAKNIVGHFCLVNGFFPSLLRILKLDLRSGLPLPWSVVLELFYQEGGYTKESFPKTLVDALLTGATRDKQLHSLSATALSHKEADPRWKNIFGAELKDRLTAIKMEREKLFKEVQIFKSERMDEEIVQILTRILTLFPDDQEALELKESLADQELEVKIHQLKQRYQLSSPLTPPEDEARWPELEKSIEKIRKNLNIEETYLLSIALFQMGFYGQALEVLRFAKEKWKVREKLWEVELLLVLKNYAEALSNAQIILSQNRALSEIIKTTLYFSAKAYHGLGDSEQAISILRGIREHDPHFRDAAILILEWSP